MEHLMLPIYNPYIQNVIKTFQTTAGQSLRGPSGYSTTWNGQQVFAKSKMSEEDYEEYRRAVHTVLKREPGEVKSVLNIDPFLLPPPFPVQQVPIFLSMDTCTSGLTKTKLDDEEIACFDIGGEKRLCLPQILTTLLPEFSQDEVHEAARNLNLNFSRCTNEQLSLLKCAHVLPTTAQNCGLITKTDAQRLSNKLLLGGESIPSRDNFSAQCFKVYHECFGKCKGLFDPDLYKSEDSACIECYECHRLFTPQRFVCHSHAAQENRICHWGFDSSNWRSYLLLAQDQGHLQQLVKCLEEIRARFSKNPRKRKQVGEQDGEQEEKRVRGNFVPHTSYGSLPKESLPVDLKQSPPIVLNPEKIVPFTGHDRYDRDFVPNISLAPSNSLTKLKKDFALDSRSHLPSVSSEGMDGALEIDVSSTDSDSEDGSLLSPPQHGNPKDMASEELRYNRETELSLVQRALNGKVGDDKASKEAFLQQYLESRGTEQKLVYDLSKAKENMQKEIEELWTKKKEYSREVREAQRIADRARVEASVRAKEAVQERNRLRCEVEDQRKVHSHELEEVKVKYSDHIEQLHTQLRQYQQMSVQMSQEINYLRAEVRKSGKDVPSIQYPVANPVSDTINGPLSTSLLKAALHSPSKDRRVSPTT